MIEADRLLVRVDGVEILKESSFRIEPGRLVALVGPNGAGKTTLLRCIAGLIKTYGGSVKISDKEVSSFTRKEMARSVGYLSQHRENLPRLKVREFLMLGRYAHSDAFKDGGSAVVERVMRRFGLESFSERVVTGLSGGELQRVVLAGVAVQETELILVDEPTTFLDPKVQQEMGSELSAMVKKEGRTVLSVTHDLGFVSRFADQVLLLSEGSVRTLIDTNDPKLPDRLSEIFSVPYGRAGGVLIPL